MLFTVTCPGCGTDFPVDRRKVPEDGVYAQCSVCPQIFWVDREMLAPAPVAAVASAPSPVQASPSSGATRAPTAPAPAAAPSAHAVAPAAASPTASEPPVAAAPAAAPQVSPPVSAAPAAAPQVSPPVAPLAHAPPAPAAPAPAPSERPTFGKRDPHERAARLARVLVSDMITYHAGRHEASVRAGTLATDFEDEIEKSWNEYVQQVGKEMAESTSYWKDALNQVLARGQAIF